MNAQHRHATPSPRLLQQDEAEEYGSARYMLYDGLHDTRCIFLTVECSCSIRSIIHFTHSYERVRTAYRVAYSLLDKVAFLVDHYWKLEGGGPINFKNVWLVGRKIRGFSIASRRC